jgi:hypothetical protein
MRCPHFWRKRHTPLIGLAPYRPHCARCCAKGDVYFGTDVAFFFAPNPNCAPEFEQADWTDWKELGYATDD